MTLLQPERRQVLRASALAWTVPVIAVATTAPAYATSGSNLSTSSATATLRAFFDQRVEATVVLRNPGSGPTTALTVTISIANDLLAAGNQTAPPAGWTLTSVNTSTDTATFTRIAQLGAATNETVVFVLRRSFEWFETDTVTVAISPGGGGVGATLTLTNVSF